MAHVWVHKNAYMGATLTYGLVRKGIEMKNATILHYDYKQRKDTTHPVLFVDKAFITIVSGLSAVYLWPLYLACDLRKVEITGRELLPDVYETFPTPKKYLFDYLLF